MEPHRVVSRVKQHMGDPNFVFQYEGKSYGPEDISSFVLRKVVGDAEIAREATRSPSGDHVPGLFRHPRARGDRQRRPAGRTQRPRDPQRADSRGHRLRAGAGRGPDGAGLRPGRRYVRHHHDRDQGSADTRHLHRRRPSPGRRALGRGHRDVPGRAVPAADVRTVRSARRPGSAQRPVPSGRARQEDADPREKAPFRVTHAGHQARVELERAKFEEITKHLLDRTIELTHEMLADAGTRGTPPSTRSSWWAGDPMPQVHNRLVAEFNTEPESYDPTRPWPRGPRCTA